MCRCVTPLNERATRKSLLSNRLWDHLGFLLRGRKDPLLWSLNDEEVVVFTRRSDPTTLSVMEAIETGITTLVHCLTLTIRTPAELFSCHRLNLLSVASEFIEQLKIGAGVPRRYPGRPVVPRGRGYLLLLVLLPRNEMATMRMTAMSATSRAYSTREAPRSSLPNRARRYEARVW